MNQEKKLNALCKGLLFFLLCAATSVSLKAQEVKGCLRNNSLQEITLTGFNYEHSYLLAKATTDTSGNFHLNYTKGYKGIAVLKTQDNNSLVIVLDEPSVIIEGENLQDLDNISFQENSSNSLFYELTASYQDRSQAYKAWRYLQQKYEASKALKNETAVVKAIQEEIERIEEKDQSQFSTLPEDSYLKWYVPKRKLLSDMPESARNYPERIEKNIQQFRRIDFNHENFKQSGLFKELIEGHYLLLENMGQTFDSMYTQMNLSTDYLIENLKHNDSLFSQVSEKLFKLFEKRSLFPAASHLSEQLLKQKDCTCELEKDFQKKLQKYGALKVGKAVPDIQLSENLKLSDIEQNVLLVFGSSTCPACQKEALELMHFYDSWKEMNIPLEIVYISLDTDKDTFQTAFRNAPWKSYCDFKAWNSPAVRDYYVYATPTYLLLDKDRKILLHPRSLAHVNAWIQG